MSQPLRERPHLQRLRQRRWARLSTLVIVVVLIAGLCLAGLRYLPWFDVHTVDVQGNQHVSTARIEAAAAIGQHQPMVQLPVATIEQRVEGLNDIATARVVRQWPNEVRIVVQERQPVAYIRTADAHDGKRFGLLGSDGVVFRAAARPSTRLPELANLTASIGDQLGEPDAAAVASLDIARALTRKAGEAVETIDASDPSNIVLVARNGVRVVWGGTSAADDKASDLALLMQRRGWGTTITNVDVSAPSSPAYR